MNDQEMCCGGTCVRRLRDARGEREARVLTAEARTIGLESRLAAAADACRDGADKFRRNPDVARTYREILAILAAQPAAPARAETHDCDWFARFTCRRCGKRRDG